MFKNNIALIVLLFIFVPSVIFSLTAEQIIEKVENNENISSTYSEGRIVSTNRFGTKESYFKSFTETKHLSLIEFVDSSLVSQRVLKTKDDIYIYYPEAEALLRLQGSALRQSILGSDLSYEDASGFSDILSNYFVELVETQILNNKETYLLSLSAKTKNIAYPKQLIWVDKGNFIIVKRKLYTQSDRLLKEVEVLETKLFNNQVLPTVTMVVDKLKKDSSTKMYIDLLQLDVVHDKSTFTLQNLTW